MLLYHFLQSTVKLFLKAFFEKFGYLEEKTGTGQQHSPADREKAIR